jgi:hypothetical protein
MSSEERIEIMMTQRKVMKISLGKALRLSVGFTSHIMVTLH